MQPHPDWDELLQFTDNFFAKSVIDTCVIYYNPNADTSYSLANGSVVLTVATITHSLEECAYVLLHELSHVHLLHFARGKALDVFSDPKTKYIYNVAADVVIDSFIAKNFQHMPEVAKPATEHLIELELWICKSTTVEPHTLHTTHQWVEHLYQFILDNLIKGDLPNLNVQVGDISEGKTDKVLPNNASATPFADVTMVHQERTSARRALYAYYQDLAWASLYRKFKVKFGGTKWQDGMLSQRTMLNRSIGGLRLMSRKHRVSASMQGNSGAHSDVLLLMDVSGSIKREWVDCLVEGIYRQSKQANLKGATLVTYSHTIKDIVPLTSANSVRTAPLRLGGGTNINTTLFSIVANHPDLLAKAKVLVILTDGVDAPISKDFETSIDIPIISTIFTPLNGYSEQFFQNSAGECLLLPQLITT